MHRLSSALALVVVATALAVGPGRRRPPGRGRLAAAGGADIRATTVVLDDAGHAAAIRVRQGTLLAWIRDSAGAWGPERGTYANEFPGDHPERGSDLRSVQLDATGR